MKLFKWYYEQEESSHGWLAVKRSMINKFNLGSRLNKSASNTKQFGQTVYLDGRFDAPIFIVEYKKEYGDGSLSVKRIRHHGKLSHPIRNYETYTPTEAELKGDYNEDGEEDIITL